MQHFLLPVEIFNLQISKALFLPPVWNSSGIQKGRQGFENHSTRNKKKSPINKQEIEKFFPRI
jgi:hypothetical protein